jgi:NAD(P)-dependent dehydrogenase (short-subunit alcohol dehydrogenase family)
MNRLTGKTIVVTAAYGDIGRATCLRCCEEGATVIMTGRKPQAEGDVLASRLAAEAKAGKAEYVSCDASSRKSIDAMFANVLSRHPRIDVVIGNAATVHNAKFLEVTTEHWHETLDLNLTGSFHLGQAAARIMVTQKPQSRPGIERGVRVNLVAPGIIMAGLTKQVYENSPDYGPRATAAVPLREFGTTMQCAEAFLFLASDESDYITGISMLVDGGASLPRRD